MADGADKVKREGGAGLPDVLGELMWPRPMWLTSHNKFLKV